MRLPSVNDPAVSEAGWSYADGAARRNTLWTIITTLAMRVACLLHDRAGKYGVSTSVKCPMMFVAERSVV
jgi:hypothetical protein